jgi:hypothetical protein
LVSNITLSAALPIRPIPLIAIFLIFLDLIKLNFKYSSEDVSK